MEGSTLMAVTATTEPAFRVTGAPTPLFRSAEIQEWYPKPAYDASADGQCFVIPVPNEADTPPVIRVI